VGFFLLILVTAILFIRPTDFIPGLESFQVYLIAILACLVTSASVIPGQLTADSLKKRPITACVLGLLIAGLLSNLVNFRIDLLIIEGFDFVKVTLFYLLLLGLVNTRDRLRCFLLSVAGILIVPIGLSVLHYYHYINLTAFVHMAFDRSTGVFYVDDDGRLRGTGTFCDPNDVCVLINVGIMLSLYGLTSARGRVIKILWVAPLALFAEALRLTESRGGLLACLASVAVLFVSRFGIRKGLLFAMVALPVILGGFGGRQVDFNLSDGNNTGQLRIQLWSTAMEVFKTSPIFGVGPNQTASFLDKCVHNSFIEPYADLGFIGGTLFVGAFYHAFRRMFQLQLRSGHAADPELDSMRPFIMAATTGYAITTMSTNHSYEVSTYGILGIAAATIRIADADRPPPGELLDGRMMMRLIWVSIVFLVAMSIYIRLFCNF